MSNSEDTKVNSNIIMNINNEVDVEINCDNKNIDKGLINEMELSKWEDERNRQEMHICTAPSTVTMGQVRSPRICQA